MDALARSLLRTAASATGFDAIAVPLFFRLTGAALRVDEAFLCVPSDFAALVARFAAVDLVPAEVVLRALLAPAALDLVLAEVGFAVELDFTFTEVGFAVEPDFAFAEAVLVVELDFAFAVALFFGAAGFSASINRSASRLREAAGFFFSVIVPLRMIFIFKRC